MSSARPRALLLLGPTGSGKSDFAMRLAQFAPVEIISVDSAQVYRGMDIGTAKPGATDRAAVRHHLLDIRDPEQAYSAGEFAADARELIADIHARGRLPLLVGGTMLYFRALLQGIAVLPRADESLRREIEARAARDGWAALHAELALRDPHSAASIHPNDAQRIQRALEILALAGEPRGTLWRAAQGGAAPDAALAVVSLAPADRAWLHGRLAARFHQMMEAGFLKEVQGLRARPGLTADHASMRAVGYRQLWQYCDERLTLPQAVEAALAATRQLAKRQLTWQRGPLLAAAERCWRLDPQDGQCHELMCAGPLKWLQCSA